MHVRLIIIISELNIFVQIIVWFKLWRWSGFENITVSTHRNKRRLSRKCGKILFILIETLIVVIIKIKKKDRKDKNKHYN